MREITNVLNKYGVKRTVKCQKTFVYGGDYWLRDKFFFKEGERYFARDFVVKGRFGTTTKCEKSDGVIKESGVWVPFDNFIDVEETPIVKAIMKMDDPKNLRLLARFNAAKDFKVVFSLYCPPFSRQTLEEMKIGEVLTIGCAEECSINSYSYAEHSYGHGWTPKEEICDVDNGYGGRVISGFHRLDSSYVAKMQAIILRNDEHQWLVFDASPTGSTYLEFD